MSPEQQASTSEQGKSGRRGTVLGIFAIVLLVAFIAWLSASVNNGRQLRSYTPDTEYTQIYDGALWGNCEVYAVTDQGARLDVFVETEQLDIKADCVKVDSRPADMAWPPYFDSSKNEDQIMIGDSIFGFCESNNVVPEAPATLRTCDKLTVGGQGDEAAKTFGKLKSHG